MALTYHIATLAAAQAVGLQGGFISGSGQGGKDGADFKTVTINDDTFIAWSAKNIITPGPSPVQTAIQKVPNLDLNPSPGDACNFMAIIPATSGSGVGTSYYYFFPNEAVFIENAWKIPNLAVGGTIGSGNYNNINDAINAIGSVGGITIYRDNNLIPPDVIASGGV